MDLPRKWSSIEQFSNQIGNVFWPLVTNIKFNVDNLDLDTSLSPEEIESAKSILLQIAGGYDFFSVASTFPEVAKKLRAIILEKLKEQGISGDTLIDLIKRDLRNPKATMNNGEPLYISDPDKQWLIQLVLFLIAELEDA